MWGNSGQMGQVRCARRGSTPLILAVLAVLAQSVCESASQTPHSLERITAAPPAKSVTFKFSILVPRSAANASLSALGRLPVTALPSPRRHLLSSSTINISNLSVTCGTGYELAGDACVACSAGSYKQLADNSSCLACPNGSTSPAGSMLVSECRCAAGYNSATGGPPCTVCPAGTFTSFSSATACASCGVGTYSSSGGSSACVACPTGASTDGAAATTILDCKCGAGYTGPYEHEVADGLSAATCMRDTLRMLQR